MKWTYWSPMNLRTNEPYVPMNLRTNEPFVPMNPSYQWTYVPMYLRTNEPMYLRTNEPTYQWTYVPMNLRTNEPYVPMYLRKQCVSPVKKEAKSFGFFTISVNVCFVYFQIPYSTDQQPMAFQLPPSMITVWKLAYS